jgi:hypothetical protein
MMGRTLLLEETIAEDLVLLLHHLVRHTLAMIVSGADNTGTAVSW